MTNIQQPEMRRSGQSPTTGRRTEDADPTAAPGGIQDTAAGRPVPKGQESPYGPGGGRWPTTRRDASRTRRAGGQLPPVVRADEQRPDRVEGGVLAVVLEEV
jgi:hypothetical protein